MKNTRNAESSDRSFLHFECSSFSSYLPSMASMCLNQAVILVGFYSMLFLIRQSHDVILSNNSPLRDLRGRVVRIADSRSLAAHRCGFESRHERSDFSSEEAFQLACGRSVVLPGC